MKRKKYPGEAEAAARVDRAIDVLADAISRAVRAVVKEAGVSITFTLVGEAVAPPGPGTAGMARGFGMSMARRPATAKRGEQTPRAGTASRHRDR